MDKIDIFLFAGIVGIAAASLGYAFGQRKKLNDISTKLDKRIDEMSDSVDVQIDDAIVKSAVKRVVDRDVKTIVTSVVENEASKIVSQYKQDMRETLSGKVSRAIDAVDIESIKQKVIESASKKAVSKITDGLEYIFDDFRKNMRRVANKSIYSY